MFSFMLIKNNPAKLYDAYASADSQQVKSKILQRLIELNQFELIEKIFISEKSTTLSDYIYNIKKNDFTYIRKHFNFFVSDIKKIIIDNLINQKEISELVFFINTEFKERIYEYLIAQFINDDDKIIDLLKYFDKDSIDLVLVSLIENRNIKAIKKLLVSEYNIYLKNYLSREYQHLTFNQILWFNEIEPNLIENSIEQKRDKGENSNFEPLQHYVYITSSYKFEDFIKFWSKFEQIIAYNDFVANHLFMKFSDVQKLYFMLWIYGISDFLDIPAFNNRLFSIENYHATILDAKSLNIKCFDNLFIKIFNQAFEEFSYKKAILAFLIDNKQFEEQLADASIFLDEMISENSYMDGFNDFIIDSGNIDKFIDKSIVKHIKHLAFLKKYNKLKFLKKYSFDLSINDIFSDRISLGEFSEKNQKIDIKSFTPETMITKDVRSEEYKIDEHQARMLYILSSEKSIAKIIEMADKRKKAIVKFEDFIFTLSKLTTDDKNDSQITEKLGNILVKTDLDDVKLAILFYLYDSTDYSWAGYLQNAKINMDDCLTSFYFYRFVTSKRIIHTVDYIKKFLSLNTFWKLSYEKQKVKNLNFLKFSPNGNFLGFIVDNINFEYLLIDSLYVQKENELLKNIVHYEFIKNQPRIIGLSTDNKVVIYDLNSKALIKEAHFTTDDVSYAFSSDAKLVATFVNKKVKLISIENINLLYEYNHKFFVTNVNFTYNCKLLISKSAFEIFILKINESEEIKFSFDLSIEAYKISNDERYLMVAFNDRLKSELCIYDIETKQIIYSQKMDVNILDIEFSFHANYFAYVIKDQQKDYQVIVYDFNELSQVAVFIKAKNIFNLRFFKDYPFICFTTENEVHVYNYHKNSLVKQMKFAEQVREVVVSSLSNKLVIYTESSIYKYQYIDVQKYATLNALNLALNYTYDNKSEELELLLKSVKTMTKF